MKYLIYLFIALVVISCASNKFSKPTSVKFNCNLQKEMFLMQLPNLLTEAGYEISINDFEKGLISARRIDTIQKKIIEMTLDCKYDNVTKDVEIKPVAFIHERDGDYNEYYNLESYREEYKKLFYDVVSNMKSNCNKVYFPNRP